MSIRIMSQIWDRAKAEGNALLVLLALADFADDTGWCWPSMASIARKARVSERGARGIIRRLEAAGLLISEPSKGRTSSRYRVIVNPEAVAGSNPSNPEAVAGSNPSNPEAAAGLNPEAVAGSNSPNPEDSDTQPGSPLPPNRQEPPIVGGGGSAREPDLLDRVIEAAQIDIQRDRSPQRWFGSEPRHTIEQWQGLDLTDDEIIETVSEVMASKTDGPPSTLAYFNPAMQRRAGLKLRPDLKPIDGGKPHDGKSARERRAEEELAGDFAFARDIDRAVAGGP